MKTMRTLLILASVLILTSNHANSQKVKESYDWYIDFQYSPAVLACLGENVTGTVTVERSWISNEEYTRYIVHEKGRGILTGADSGDEYTISFEYNSVFHWHQMLTNGGFTFPMLLKRNGKLVAVIHESYRGVTLFEGWTGIVDRYVYDVECK